MLHLYALRAARARQLRARAVRPLARRRFPGEPPREAVSVPAAAGLWRSQAFEAGSPPDTSTRLGRFHRQYGEDVLESARAGELEEARRLVTTWIEAHPPHVGDAWHPYPLSTRVGNWIAALTLLPDLTSTELTRSLWHQLRRLERNVEDDVLGNHVIRNARALVLGGASFGAPDLTRRGIDLLRRELPEQVLPDGAHYERSPAYHLVVLRDLLEVNAVSPHSWLAEAIERMRVFAAALARPDGRPSSTTARSTHRDWSCPIPRRAWRYSPTAASSSFARATCGLRSAADVPPRRSCPRTRMRMRCRSSFGGAAARLSSTRARTPTSRARIVTGFARRARTRP